METPVPSVIGSLVLVPILDALAPADPGAPGRRIRNTAIWLAISAWLLPEFAKLGTDTTEHRAIICAAFVTAAVAAHFRTRFRWARIALPIAAIAAGVIVAVFGHGAAWGLAFVVFSVLVVAATEMRNRFLRIEPLAPEPDPLPPLPRTTTKVLNALAWIGISIFFMKEWAGQAMVVPTGSMQPTIMGAVGRNASGDHLFVDNFSYLFRDPRRWEIVVFQFPLFRDRYFVKRVVGLAGEHLEIRDGDIWIDGKIATKPPVVQHTLWRELFPQPNFLGKRKSISDGFTQDVSTGGNWKRLSDAEVLCAPGKTASFAFCGGSGSFADARLAFTAVPDAKSSAMVLARITSRGVPVMLAIDAAGESGGAEFTIGGNSVPLHHTVQRSGGDVIRVELCVADGEAWALVDGREVARAGLPPDRRGKNRVEIGASVNPVTFRDVYVGRDIVYEPGAGPAVYDVPSDGFFFIGDNVEGSEDSRKWTVEEFRTATGDVFRAAPSIVTESGTGRDSNIKSEGGSWRFLDVDAVPRSVPREGTTVASSVPWPFARRSHLIGRAILIFWPFGVAEAGFRPRLIP